MNNYPGAMYNTVVLLLLLALPTGCVQAPGDSPGDISACQLRLSNAVFVVKTYQIDNDGGLPTNLVKVLEQYGGGGAQALMTCPSKAHTHKPNGPADWDYAYVDWNRYLTNQDPPPSFPLYYEIWLRDHGGKGVNVALASGAVFFDRRAQFIRDFIASHPSLGLQEPR